MPTQLHPCPSSRELAQVLLLLPSLLQMQLKPRRDLPALPQREEGDTRQNGPSEVNPPASLLQGSGTATGTAPAAW